MTVAHPSPTDPVADGPTPAGPPWSVAQKLLFRFGLLYLASYTFPFPFQHVPLLDRGAAWVEGQHAGLVHAVGVQLLGLPDRRPAVGGCGDRADHYVTVLVDVALALVLAAVWSWLDRGRPSYRRLAYWATACVRYYLACTLLDYGAIKIFKSQFAVPRPTQLLSPLGDLSPMGLLWAFMGISSAYCLFIGLCEALGGVLLLFRRTTLAGALLSSSVLANVFLLNVFYGVCVKLYSAHLLLMSTLLLTLDARRLVDALLLGRAVPALAVARPSRGPRTARALSLIKLIAVPGIIALSVRKGHASWRDYGDAAPKPPLYGIWDVESFARDGRVITSADAWRWLAVESGPYATLRPREGDSRPIGFRVDSNARVLRLRLDPNDDATVDWSYTTPAPNILELEGPLDGAVTHIRLKQRTFIPLLGSRFRWTSDLN